MNRPIRLASTFLAGLLAGPVAAATYTVGPMAGCTHASVQAALDAAQVTPGTDRIRIVAGTFTAQALVVDRHDVEIVGGYASCAATASSGMTRLSGSGGKSRPVLSLYGPDDAGSVKIRVSRLELTAGRHTRAGGGLFVHGRGSFFLTDSVVTRNRAGSGGGIAVIGTSGEENTSLTITDGIVSANEASDGGGIEVTGARLRVTGAKSMIVDNRADGFSTDSGNGGGLHISGGVDGRTASADLDGGHHPDGLFARNTAVQRGGGAWIGARTRVQLYTSTPAWPLRLHGNAASYGAGLFAVGRDTVVSIWEGVIESNHSSYGGGGLFAADGARVRMLPARDAQAPAGTVACAKGMTCNRLTGNTSLDGGIIYKNGAAVMLANRDADVQTHVLFDSVVVSDHLGASVFADNCFVQDPLDTCLHPIGLDIVNSRIAPNLDAISAMHFPFATKASCFSCTIAGIRGSGFGGESEPVMFDTRGVLTLGQGIVWEPGRPMFGPLVQIAVVAADLVAHDLSGFTPNGNLRDDDPLFVDAANGDFHLRTGSPALDAAVNVLGLPFDLDGHPRVIDLPGQPNGDGALDLGAYERPL